MCWCGMRFGELCSVRLVMWLRDPLQSLKFLIPGGAFGPLVRIAPMGQLLLLPMSMLPSDAHDSLFSNAVLKIGEIHSYFLAAFSLVRTPRTKAPDIPRLLRKEDRTELAKEIGGDEIHWWVFTKEDDIAQLSDRTERALAAAQTLKEGSAALKRNRPRAYKELLSSLTTFADAHETEINILLEFVRWLHSRHPAAPGALFSYRVWGSTRRGDRLVNVDADQLANERGSEMVRRLSEIALGLRSNFLYAYDRAAFDVEEDVYLRLGPEQVPEGGIEIPVDEVVLRASSKAYDECATYFAFIRDSLKNILLDIEKYRAQQNLLLSDAFWRAFIQRAIGTRKTENILWDFKKTLPMWHIARADEKERAKVTFAEDVAAFANARGGVLVVGVTNEREIVGVGDGRELESRVRFAADVLAKHLEVRSPACVIPSDPDR